MILVVATIPKSGTYFVNQLHYELFPNNFIGRHSCYGGGMDTEEHLLFNQSELNELEQFESACYLGHWRYDNNALHLISGYKTIFLYRHPLDIAVSFVESANLEHLRAVDSILQYLYKIENRAERYSIYLKGIPTMEEHAWGRGFKKILQERVGWVHESSIFAIKYEDLIYRTPRLMEFAAYLEVSHKDIYSAMDRALLNKNCITLRKGTTGNWVIEMPDEVKNLYIDELQDIIQEMGYDV